MEKRVKMPGNGLFRSKKEVSNTLSRAISSLRFALLRALHAALQLPGHQPGPLAAPGPGAGALRRALLDLRLREQHAGGWHAARRLWAQKVSCEEDFDR